MTEEEQLGIAEEQTPEGATEEEVVEQTEETPEGKISKEEVMEICVRYEKARSPWANDSEAREMAVGNLSDDGAQEYLAEVMEWHKAGEPPLEEVEAEEVKETPKGMTEEEALGIAD